MRTRANQWDTGKNQLKKYIYIYINVDYSCLVSYLKGRAFVSVASVARLIT